MPQKKKIKKKPKMHRAYQPVTPANNIYLKQRWDQDIFYTHRRKVEAAKAVIDNKPPKTYMHLHIKLKKLQMEGERLAIVERDNRILLEKMAHIMRTGGLVDNVKRDYTHKSLNKTKRQRELLRITYENMAILKRINAKEPHYKHLKWEAEHHCNQSYMMNVAKYHHHWRKEKQCYLIRKQQQDAANRRIKDQVLIPDKTPPKDSLPPLQSK
ncbi:sperm axonemal maintenance protein CFAP97D1-like [Haliotis cracherodii]|uniref:sperm axonemal maintenance protein CFAP97D1-like n=1 Tax=Haliotis cracherodii TaxID=6455 RepID=UPI0039EB00AA